LASFPFFCEQFVAVGGVEFWTHDFIGKNGEATFELMKKVMFFWGCQRTYL
jgi:hypothetical protein